MENRRKKTVLVTGGSSGIGRVLVTEFARSGYNVIVNFRRNTEDAVQVRKELESIAANSKILQADVSKYEGAERLIKEAANYFDGIDILINGVGDYIKKSVDQFEIDEWRYIADSNLNSVFYMTKLAIPYMRENNWGRIINFGISGVEKLNRNPEMTAYNIAKTGVLMLTEAFAQTEGKYGITINMVSPGIVDNQKYSVKFKEEIIKSIPAGIIGQPLDVFNLIKFLVSDEAHYINGANISVSGGYFII